MNALPSPTQERREAVVGAVPPEALLAALTAWAARVDVPGKVHGGGLLTLQEPGRVSTTLTTNGHTLVCVRGAAAGVPSVTEAALPLKAVARLARAVHAGPTSVHPVDGAEFRAFVGEPDWITGVGIAGPRRRPGWVYHAPLDLRLLAQPLALLPQVERYRVAPHPTPGGVAVYVYGDGFFVLQMGIEHPGTPWESAPRWPVAS